MYINYSYIFSLGGNSHKIEVYEKYSKEQGLLGEPKECFEDTRFDRLMKKANASLNKIQKEKLKTSSGDRPSHLVIDNEGKTLECR